MIAGLVPTINRSTTPISGVDHHQVLDLFVWWFLIFYHGIHHHHGPPFGSESFWVTFRNASKKMQIPSTWYEEYPMVYSSLPTTLPKFSGWNPKKNDGFQAQNLRISSRFQVNHVKLWERSLWVSVFGPTKKTHKEGLQAETQTHTEPSPKYDWRMAWKTSVTVVVYLPRTQLTFFWGVDLPFYGANLPKYGAFGSYVYVNCPILHEKCRNHLLYNPEILSYYFVAVY